MELNSATGAKTYFRINHMTAQIPNKRALWLDYIKVIALLFVAIAHFVSVATFAPEINYVISSPGSAYRFLVLEHYFTLPILPQETHNLWKIESFLLNHFGVQFGVIGVVLFFLVTGYLTPGSQEKYNSEDVSFASRLFQKRLLAFWPTVLICLLINTFFTFLLFKQPLQGFTLTNFLCQLSFLNVFIPVNLLDTGGGYVFFGGVGWFLNVLIFFFFLGSYVFPRFSLSSITFCFFLLLLIEIFPFLVWKNSLTLHYSYYAPHCGVLLLGVLLNYVVKAGKFNFCVLVNLALFISMMFGLYLIDKHFNNSLTTYSTFNTYVFALTIFFFFFFVDKYLPQLLLKGQALIAGFSNLFLPFYLLHVVLGLPLLAFLNKFFNSPYPSLIISISVLFILSYFVNGLAKKISSSFFYKRLG